MTFVASTLRISAGVVLWAVHFGVAYGLTALACARGHAALVPWVVGGATLVAAGLAILVIVSERRRGDAFVSWLAAAIAALALMAIVLEAIPVLIVPACA